ncbi:hypothetical protein GR7B_00206 [Vibrio phage vB_VcorM_GR7B]|nr:hypothetical protein GR7B_00206 [Vibrio phage vB_VcorM_GR7B]
MEIYVIDAIRSRLQAFVNNENTDMVHGLTEATDTKIEVESELDEPSAVWKSFSTVATARATFTDIYGGQCAMDFILVVDEGGEANTVMVDALVRRIKDATTCHNTPICLVDMSGLEHSEYAVRFPYEDDVDDDY